MTFMINSTKIIDGNYYAEFIKRGASNLLRQRDEINNLNVFPIPDGDTGDNMYLTIKAGAGVAASESISDVSDAVSKEMLYSARGNSGVILSRIFSGVAKGLSDRKTAGVAELKEALKLGVEEAYSAVDAPVEGTMLTVFRDAVDAAEKCDNDGTFLDYFNLFLPAMKNSLERTPDLLPVLKDAGVVDSGGAGLVAIAEGLFSGSAVEKEESSQTKSPDFSLFDSDSTLKYGYCTEFLLRLQSSKVDTDSFDEAVISDWLSENGESVVCFRDGSIIKAHVHTFSPGDVLNFCQKYGEFLTVKIENMTLQHNGTAREKAKKPKPRKKYGAVAVASGKGMTEMFRELGADAVISGGQSMNPSAEDFIRAFGEVNAENIFVFPNNGNIIMAAEQAAGMYNESNVTVIKSKTIGDGYIALSALDTAEGRSLETIVSSMNDDMAHVRTGMISRASRTTELNGLTISEGDCIGFSGHSIYSSAKTPHEAAEILCRAIGSDDDLGVCILITGEGADEAETALIAKHIESTYPLEVIVSDGGQPVYDYILIFD